MDEPDTPSCHSSGPPGFGFWSVSFLKIGVTFAVFQSDGIDPVWMDWLNTNVNTGAILGAIRRIELIGWEDVKLYTKLNYAP